MKELEKKAEGILERFILGALALAAMTGTGGYFIGRQSIPIEQPRQTKAPQVNYEGLRNFKTDPSVATQNVRTVMYDFGRESILTLSDLSGDGNTDHLEVQPYQGGLSHIYLSRELAPSAEDGPYFTVVDQNFFDAFNRIE